MTTAGFCSQCGAPFTADVGFCQNCGAPLSNTAAATVGPPTAAARRQSPAALLLVVGVIAAVAVGAFLLLGKDDSKATGNTGPRSQKPSLEGVSDMQPPTATPGRPAPSATASLPGGIGTTSTAVSNPAGAATPRPTATPAPKTITIGNRLSLEVPGWASKTVAKGPGTATGAGIQLAQDPEDLNRIGSAGPRIGIFVVNIEQGKTPEQTLTASLPPSCSPSASPCLTVNAYGKPFDIPPLDSAHVTLTVQEVSGISYIQTNQTSVQSARCALVYDKARPANAVFFFLEDDLNMDDSMISTLYFTTKFN